MPEFLLPKLSPTAAIAPVNPGNWDEKSITADALSKLANGLEVAENKNKTESIDSIPDVWARPIFFKMALYAGAANQNFDRALHEKIKGEWRAILAMLALQDMRNLPISVDAVNLAGGTVIEKMLLTLAPKDSVTGNASDWQNIYVISYNSKLLAVTSPATLVAAAADYSRELAGQIHQPWSNDGKYLTDPTPYLSPNELSGLHQWLQDLLNNLQTFIPPDIQTSNETCTQLLEALRNYINDVNLSLGAAVVAQGIKVIPAGMNLHIGIFQFLDYKVQPPPATPESSEVRLIPSPSRSNSTPLLLVSPEMLKKISTGRGIPMAQLSVWAGLTAINVNENSLQGGRNMIGKVSIGAAQWRRPEEFFTNQLAICDGGNVFEGVINVRGSETLAAQDDSVILPLKPEILDYFEPKEIAQRLHIAKVDNSYKVTFKFPLSGQNGNQIEYTAEKSYPVQEVLRINTTLPVIEIWPNFKREGWKKYYLYYENSDAQNQSQTLGEDFFYVSPLSYGNNIAGDTPPQGLKNLYTARLSDFPEALVCTVNWTAEGRHSPQLIEVGFVLLNPPQNVPVNFGANWKVGIDFGTSSTMLYYRQNLNPPEPLNLQSNLFQVTNSGDLRNRTYRNFIPSSTADQQNGSFLSIFQMLQNVDPMHPIRPLQDGNIFWLLSADGGDAEDFRNNNSRIDANLKWKSDPTGRKKVTAYIQQICLQVLAEAAKKGVNSLEWNFSYPTAFPPDQQQGFKFACRDSVRDILRDSGFPPFSPQILKYWAESQASAYCFGDLGGNALAGGAICLDIGAGTTDISVLSGVPAKIVYHTSLQFAGRYLFRSIYKNYNVVTNKNMQFGGVNDEQRNTLVDADMRKYNEKYLENLKNNTANPEVEKVLQIAQFAVAGIFYYLGGLVGLLHEKGIYEEDFLPEIYVGGNGSRIFSWICGDTFFDNENIRMSVFKDMFMATSKLDGHFNVVLSPIPKIEVAHGMVGEDFAGVGGDFFDPEAIAVALFGEDGKDPLIAESVFAGDAFISEGDLHKKTDFISAYNLNKGVKIKTADELKNFTDKFNLNRNIWCRSQRINISNAQLASVSRGVLGVYGMQIGKDTDNISVEPVFILELKKFMEMLA